MSASLDALFAEVADDAADRLRAQNEGAETAKRVFKDLTAHQRDVVRDASKFKSLLVPRRGGKSWVAFAASVILSVQKPGTIWPFLALTLDSAKRIYWDIIQEFNRRYGLGLKLNANEFSWTYPNGSRGFLRGVASREELDKLRGFETDGITIDECGTFAPPVLEELVYQILLPLCISRNSSIWLAGTPGPVLDGPFYRATSDALQPAGKNKGMPWARRWADRDKPLWKGKAPAWSFHSWTIQDNTAMPHQWAGALELKELNGWDDDHPYWRAEYLGQWVAQDDALVYAYGRVRRSDKPERVAWQPNYRESPLTGLPPNKKWNFLLGLDLGFEDDTAFVVAAYSDEDRRLHHVYDFKRPHMVASEVAAKVEELEIRFGGFDAIVVDAANKQFVETLSVDYGLHMVPAEKKDKFGYVERLNSDFHSGLICILPAGHRFHDGSASELATELEGLQWDLRKNKKAELARWGRLVEHPDMPNHLCDAFLYLWRYSYHALGREPVEDTRSPAEIAAQLDMEAAVRASWARDREPGWHPDPYDAPEDPYMLTSDNLGWV